MRLTKQVTYIRDSIRENPQRKQLTNLLENIEVGEMDKTALIKKMIAYELDIEVIDKYFNEYLNKLSHISVADIHLTNLPLADKLRETSPEVYKREYQAYIKTMDKSIDTKYSEMQYHLNEIDLELEQLIDEVMEITKSYLMDLLQ